MILNDPIYRHYPVSIDTFIDSPDYLNAGAECWPEVRKLLKAVFNADPLSLRLSTYREVVACEGIGAGKSFLVSVIFSYSTYRLLCYRNPQGLFGLARGSNIALLNMSKSAQQAKKIVFGEIKSRINNSPWFQKYGLPDPTVQSELRFPNNIIVFPGNSQETFPLGYNVFLANMDEASFYTETETHDVAEEMYDALDRRITSRFGQNGLNIITSSPRYEDDFTEKKMNEARQNPEHLLAIRRATWDMKPDDRVASANGQVFKTQHPKTKEDVYIPMRYERAFLRNPKKAWRDFGAVPSLVLEQYFTDTELEKLQVLSNNGHIPPCVEGNQISGKMYALAGTDYYVHIDLGIVRDACGFAMGHYQNGKVVIDAVYRIVCRNRAQTLMESGEPYDMVIGDSQVNFEEVRQLIYTLMNRGFNIRKVTYDNFQSVDSRQILEASGIMTDVLSVDRDTSAYDTMKTLINTDRFECVKHPHFLHECSRLEYKNGKKVDHPPNASKDCADAVAGVSRSIIDSFDEDFDQEYLVVDESVRVEIGQEI